MWIFAYGSLIFRPGFPFVERRPAWVAGFYRRFWQGSPDHRGTPEAPGRVVTLLAEPAEHVGGCAYRIDPALAETILAALDEREIAGFERKVLPLLDRPEGLAFGEGTTWIAGNTNPHFLGPLEEKDIAAHVRRSRGPSGPNLDYVLSLHRALRELAIDDPHVDAIASFLEVSEQSA